MIAVGGIIRKRINQSSFAKPKYKIFGGVIYFASVDSPDGNHPAKVGFSQQPNHRLALLQSNSPYPVELLGALLVPDGMECKSFETEIRARLVAQKEKRLDGEWFDIHPDFLTEWISHIAKVLQTRVISPQEIKEEWL